MSKFGFDETEWAEAKDEAKAALQDRAKDRGTMTYSELVNRLNAISIDPHDLRLGNLLAEISTEEDAAGRGMLSAIVVHKNGDMQPGKGFFDLALSLGRNTNDPDKCWSDEVNKVYGAWAP